MGVTHTAAAHRDRLRARPHRRGFSLADLLLIATSFVAAMAIALAYFGRVSISDQSRGAWHTDRVVNLNTVEDPGQLLPALATVVESVNERRVLADQLFLFILDERKQGRWLPNVGAVARAAVGGDVIDRTPHLDTLRRRLESLRQDALDAGRMPPESIPLLNAGELAALKPLAVVRTRGEFRRQVLLFGALYLLGFHAVAWVWRRRAIQRDRLLLPIAHLLTAVGFAVLLSRPDPLRDTMLFVRFGETIVTGLAVMTAISLVDFDKIGFVEVSYLPLIAALSLSVLLILFGSGPGRSTAKVNLGPLQPMEAIRFLLALFIAGYCARKWELLRSLRGRAIRNVKLPAWLDLPRAEYVLPVLAGVALALVLFFVQRDLGPALFLCCMFLAIFAVARGRIGMALAGFLVLFAGFYAGYRLPISLTLTNRIRMWQSPWDNAAAGGDQIAHALWAMATGGWLGTGLGLGDVRYLPAGHTDLVLAAVGEELGVVGVALVGSLYALLVWRGIRIARLARNDYGFFLATTLTLFLVVPVVIMASGILGVTPLTGIVTPFLSYGGSAMVANFAALGVLAAIHADRHTPGDFEPFRVPGNWLAGSLVLCAVALFVVAADVQVVHADDYVVRPHLGMQADGGRRFEYNPRVLDVVRLMPRGTIYDRQGLPLATENAAVIARAAQAYAGLGISLVDACEKSAERCYPLGSRAFHLLGDARTRVNWSASNSSYVERDDEGRLRGFDDHATLVRTTDAAGRPMVAARRDYSEVIPAVRHRYDPHDPDAARLLSRPRDVQLTIDARLQLRVSAIVESYAKKTSGRAAAVVLDPDTGDLLASASYPWPASLPASDEAGAVAAGSLLDRARYGLYPPGSTFKVVTAAAALCRDPESRNTRFMCIRLPDGRVGAFIKGWRRPVRDDVLDKEPHGAIEMHDAFVHSCNAYFAQLAVELGPQPLLDVADRLGISLTPLGNAGARIRETLPQVGYGQGGVVMTPLRMARAVAAVASNGVVREPRWKRQSAPPAASGQLLDADSARLLGRYMRDVVLSGTGRSLRDHPWRIAGKTGTAELSDGPSHAWFAGFAPFGSATKRIAFAVLVENGGYGGRTAAPAAGEIVDAAAAAGLVK